MLVGDALHNLLDGVLIAAAFLTDVHLGFVTALAIMAHEIPQEVGNFAVLLHSGVSRRRALALNLLTSLTAVIGGVVGLFCARDRGTDCCRFALAVAAASLLYVAVADLIPGPAPPRRRSRSGITQVLLIGLRDRHHRFRGKTRSLKSQFQGDRMHNPYAHVPAPAAFDARRTTHCRLRGRHRPNTGYYLKRFEEFDAGESKAGWHWPAFFVDLRLVHLSQDVEPWDAEPVLALDSSSLSLS